MPAYDTMIEALDDLNNQGYTIDFNLAFDHLKCSKTGVCLFPSEFEITGHYRFEGESDPDDESIVYTVASKDGNLKGLLVSAYGAYSEGVSEVMIQKLAVHHG